MARLKFIEDEEIENLNGDKDLLETKRYAHTLKETILSAGTPFTIGLFGEWGSGKSSIVNTVQDELKSHTSEKIKFIKYDAWKYANDSFRRMFIKEVQRELKFDGTDEFNSFYANKTIDTNINSKFNRKYFSLIFIAFILVIVIVPFLNINKSLELTLQSIITFFAVAVAFFKNSFSEYKVSAQKPMIFAPEQFENIFDEMMSKSLKKYNIFSQMKEWFQGNHYEKNIDKVVIIIDNIDRCDKETAYELLTNIKNFLEREGIIFVVPIDDSALRRHLKDKNNEDNKEADEFLRKFFNVTLKIKYFQSRDLFMFTNDINKKHTLNLQPDTVDIIAKEYATNPRRVIQFLNNLITELNIIEYKYDNDFSTKYESLIALLLIIREEWPCVYKQIASKPHLLKQFKNIVFDEKSTTKGNVEHFINSTKAVYENENEHVIEKLISNMDNDEKIPSEIIDNIKNSKYDALQEYIEEDEHFKELLYYLIKELETEIVRETFKIGTLNRFKNIIKLNELKELPIEINKKLYRLFHNKNQRDQLLKIIENLDEDNFDRFYMFVDTNQKQDIKYLEQISISEYKKLWKEKIANKDALGGKAKIWINGLEHFINISSNTIVIQELSDIFVNYYDYHSDSPFYENLWVNEDKLKYIVGDKLINYLIDKAEPSLGDENFKELLYISRLKLVNIENLENLFKKIVIIPDKLYNTKNSEEAKKEFMGNALSNLENIVALNKNIPKKDKFKSENIINYLTSINKGHIVKCSHPAYVNLRKYDQAIRVMILDNIDKKDQKNILELYIEIYRITDNGIDVINYIKQLVDKYIHLKEAFFDSLIKLRDEGAYSLKPLFDYLIEFNDIDKNLFNLYEKLFVQDEIDNEKIKEKLTTLTMKYLSEKNTTIQKFLFAMLSHKKTKDILTNIVVNLSTENIVELPKDIQHLTYDYLCKNDRLFDIEDKIEFIKEILNFDNKYKDCVVKIIVSKLQDGRKVGGALDILGALKRPTFTNKTDIYTALKKQEKHAKYTNEVKKFLKKYKNS